MNSGNPVYRPFVEDRYRLSFSLSFLQHHWNTLKDESLLFLGNQAGNRGRTKRSDEPISGGGFLEFLHAGSSVGGMRSAARPDSPDSITDLQK